MLSDEFLTGVTGRRQQPVIDNHDARSVVIDRDWVLHDLDRAGQLAEFQQPLVLWTQLLISTIAREGVHEVLVYLAL